MKTIKATKQNSKQISHLMFLDLKNPNPNFLPEMINKWREHAREENIKKEFENPKLIAFLTIDKKNVNGFIVGYEENSNNAIIHYITAEKNEQKTELLNKFIRECKTRNMKRIITDTFEFIDNNNFLKSNGFKLMKKEKITENLEMLWYELNLI